MKNPIGAFLPPSPNLRLRTPSLRPATTSLNPYRCPHRPKCTMQNSPPHPRPPAPAVATAEMIATANAAADAAGKIIREYFRKPFDINFKSDQTPVTIADRRAEDAMREIISAAFPLHAIVGEEGGRENEILNGYTWVLDPIDGTKAFMSGRPTFGTLIALAVNNVPVLGIIDQCVTKERWVGTPDGTTMNGKRVNVNGGRVLENCTVHATTPDMFEGYDVISVRRVKNAVRGFVYGSDCYAYALLASGFVDAVVEADMKVWDFAALVPVVKGAGGNITDWSGRQLVLDSDGRIVAAANKDVHMKLVGLLTRDKMERAMKRGLGNVVEPLMTNEGGNGLSQDPGPGHLESMTGYGEKTVRVGDVEVFASLKSVNSRYCDVQIKGPKNLSVYDSALSAMVRSKVVRGKVMVLMDVSVGKNDEIEGILPVKVDKKAAQSVKRLLDEVAQAACVKSEATLSDILNFSEVLVRRDTGAIAQQVFDVAKRAVTEAIEDLRATRRREGAILQEDLLMRTRKIREVLQDVEARAPARVEREKKRLEDMTRDIGEGIDERRLETEITLYADRADITEEVVRLAAHLRLFEMTLFAAHEPIGRRLSFLLQEMHREVTTIGSKALDAPIAHLSVIMKEEIEKIREQCQNVC